MVDGLDRRRSASLRCTREVWRRPRRVLEHTCRLSAAGLRLGELPGGRDESVPRGRRVVDRAGSGRRRGARARRPKRFGPFGRGTEGAGGGGGQQTSRKRVAKAAFPPMSSELETGEGQQPASVLISVTASAELERTLMRTGRRGKGHEREQPRSGCRRRKEQRSAVSDGGRGEMGRGGSCSRVRSSRRASPRLRYLR